MQGLKYDISGLKKLKKNLTAKMTVKVGILSGSTNRTTASGQNEIDNASLGFKMEYGSREEKIPARSWLEMPLKNHLSEYFKVADYSKEMVEGSVKSFLDSLIGRPSIEVLEDAFFTGGFGQWEKNSPVTILLKGSGKPLIDTKQLMNAVSSRVVIKK